MTDDPLDYYMTIDDITDDWLTTADAARVLISAPETLMKAGRQSEYLIRRNLDRKGVDGRPPVVYWAEDIHFIARIRRGAKCGIRTAIRIFDAIRAGEITEIPDEAITAQRKLAKVAEIAEKQISQSSGVRHPAWKEVRRIATGS